MGEDGEDRVGYMLYIYISMKTFTYTSSDVSECGSRNMRLSLSIDGHRCQFMSNPWSSMLAGGGLVFEDKCSSVCIYPYNIYIYIYYFVIPFIYIYIYIYIYSCIHKYINIYIYEHICTYHTVC